MPKIVFKTITSELFQEQLSFRQNQIKQENIFNNVPVRSLAVAMSINSVAAGSFREKCFSFMSFIWENLQLFELEEHFFH